MNDKMAAMEGEKAQLQAQISNLNSTIIAMKAEATQQSDSAIEFDKRIKEKEQAISELGTLIKKQKEQLKNKDEQITEKENQLVKCLEIITYSLI